MSIPVVLASLAPLKNVNWNRISVSSPSHFSLHPFQTLPMPPIQLIVKESFQRLGNKVSVSIDWFAADQLKSFQWLTSVHQRRWWLLAMLASLWFLLVLDSNCLSMSRNSQFREFWLQSSSQISSTYWSPIVYIQYALPNTGISFKDFSWLLVDRHLTIYIENVRWLSSSP